MSTGVSRRGAGAAGVLQAGLGNWRDSATPGPLASIGPGRRSVTIPMTQRNRLGGRFRSNLCGGGLPGPAVDAVQMFHGSSSSASTRLACGSHTQGRVCVGTCRVLSRSRAKEAPVSRRSNWLLYLLSGADPSNRSEDLTWLDPISVMKALFLAQNERGADRSARSPVANPPFEFVPYSYGPFTPVVYSELENLESVGLVQSRQAPGRSYSLWALTEAGWSAACSASTNLGSDERARLKHAYGVVTSKSFNELLAYVYGRYPKSATQSVHPAARAQ